MWKNIPDFEFTKNALFLIVSNELQGVYCDSYWRKYTHVLTRTDYIYIVSDNETKSNT